MNGHLLEAMYRRRRKGYVLVSQMREHFGIADLVKWRVIDSKCYLLAFRDPLAFRNLVLGLRLALRSVPHAQDVLFRMIRLQR